jgi:type I restriction enzyme, S subunit
MSALPMGWVETTLGEFVSKLRTGPFGSSVHKTDYIEGGIPLINPMHINNGKIAHSQNVTVSKAKARDLSEFTLKLGDIIIGRRGEMGRCAVIAPEQEGWLIGTGSMGITTNSALQPNFLQRFLASPISIVQLTERSIGSTMVNLNQSILLGLPIAVPPLPEQQRIVAKVDGLMARTARARKDLAHIPTLITRYKQRFLSRALAGDQTRAWRLSNEGTDEDKQTSVIETPAKYEMHGVKSWKFVTIGDVCRIEGGSQPPKSTFVYEPRPGYIRLIQIRDYKSDKHIVYIPEELARRFVSKTDIMIGRYGPPIFQILRGLEGAYNVALMKAVPHESIILPDFLYWFLKGPTLLSYVELDSKRSSGQDGVNKDHLLKFPVPLPTLSEQTEIVRRIETAFAWLDRLAAEHTSATKLLPKLDAAILTKAFAGHLVPQNPTDEPASVLLARVKAERNAMPAKAQRKISA